MPARMPGNEEAKALARERFQNNKRRASCHPTKPHYGRGLCSKCWQQLWVKENPERWLRWRLKRFYGITLEYYNDLLTAQGGLCALCRDPPDKEMLVVDHDHATKKVRALLCRRCNQGLGMLGDNVAGLIKALEYLQSHAGAVEIQPHPYVAKNHSKFSVKY